MIYEYHRFVFIETLTKYIKFSVSNIALNSVKGPTIVQTIVQTRNRVLPVRFKKHNKTSATRDRTPHVAGLINIGAITPRRRPA